MAEKQKPKLTLIQGGADPIKNAVALFEKMMGRTPSNAEVEDLKAYYEKRKAEEAKA